MIDAVDMNGRALRTGDLVRDQRTGLHEVTRLCTDVVTAQLALRRRAYRPVELDGNDRWTCPHLVTLEIGRQEAA